MKHSFTWERRLLSLGRCVLGVATCFVPLASFGQDSAELARVTVGDAAEIPAGIANRVHLQLTSARELRTGSRF